MIPEISPSVATLAARMNDFFTAKGCGVLEEGKRGERGGRGEGRGGRED
jgi:hypothetical protein